MVNKFCMSKWCDDFSEKYKDTNTVKRLNKEIKDALNKKKMQKQVDQDISNVIKGKCKRKNDVLRKLYILRKRK